MRSKLEIVTLFKEKKMNSQKTQKVKVYHSENFWDGDKEIISRKDIYCKGGDKIELILVNTGNEHAQYFLNQYETNFNGEEIADWYYERLAIDNLNLDPHGEWELLWLAPQTMFCSDNVALVVKKSHKIKGEIYFEPLIFPLLTPALALGITPNC